MCIKESIPEGIFFPLFFSMAELLLERKQSLNNSHLFLCMFSQTLPQSQVGGDSKVVAKGKRANI